MLSKASLTEAPEGAPEGVSLHLDQVGNWNLGSPTDKEEGRSLLGKG